MNLRSPHDFERVYDAHNRSVYAAAMRVLGDPAQAGDVVQDVFLRLWRRPDSFDARRGDLGVYLRLMARSRAIDLIRESQTRGRATDRLKIVVGGDDPHGGPQPDEALVLDDERAGVRAALHALPSSQREALVLAYWGGMTAEQIARREAIPLGTAKSRIRLGLAKLRTELEPGAMPLAV